MREHSHGSEAGVFEQLAEGEAEVRMKSLHGYQSVAWHSIFSQKDNKTLQTASSFLKGRGERNTNSPVRSAVGQYQRNTSRCVVNSFLVASASKPTMVTDRRMAR